MVALDEFVVACTEAGAEADPRAAIREVLDRAAKDRQLQSELRQDVAGLNLLHRAPDLTVIEVTWPPRFTLFPHDHRMWATILICRGRELNTFYRRHGNTAEAAGGRDLDEGEVALLGRDAIHSVTNPASAYTKAIHVYGGDFVATPRSQWDPETLVEEPYDFDAVNREFDRAEREHRSTPHA
jgi:predicted metal-dependent enzyme (double-stranded beta helix superfamily)